VTVLDQHYTEGMQLAVEGKLVSRFYRQGIERKHIVEVEVNDIIIL
jgi:single-stranded DNA-binding protein